MNKLDIYRRILTDSISTEMRDDDILLHMVVMHTHDIAVSPGIIVDGVGSPSEQGVVLAALTRRHVAEFVASQWEPHEQRGDLYYWYWLYDERTPYESFEEVTSDLRDRALAIKSKLENHVLVARLIED